MTTHDAALVPAYRERLWPGPVVWILAVGTIAALAIAYGSSMGALTGWLVALGAGVITAALIARSAARVQVTDAAAARRSRGHRVGVHRPGAAARC